MRQKSNYKILKLVGRGQFGKVFTAIDRGSGNLVALKELNQKQLSTTSFLRELNFLVTLNHSNIVSCKAIEHQQRNRYIVMDYCEGGTLRNLIDDSPQLTLSQSVKLVIDILSGLKFAHDRGIIHRDIKPANILLKICARGWTAHISDFGIAKLHQEINPHSVMGSTGSPAYMAPEQFYGQYSYSCDLYAVGIILYELVMGKRPFSGMPKELLAAHLNQSVEISKQLPFVLRSAIAKSLQKMPGRRFASAAKMLDALKLVQTILETDHYTPIPSAVELTTTLRPISQSILAHKVTHLAIASEQVYLGSGNQLQIQHYQNSSLHGEVISQCSMTLDKPIRNLQLNSQGCLISTSSSLYHLPQNMKSEEFRFFSRTLLPTASFPTNTLVSIIDAQGFWLAVSYLPTKSKTPSFEIFNSNCQLRRSFINRKLWKFLIALDHRYGLGIYQNKANHTEFKLFNRRGNWLANYIVEVKLDLVIYNPQFSNQILATEVDNPGMVIVIALEKFNIKRINIDLNTSLVASCDQGYLLSDNQGKIIVINGSNYKINQYQIPLPPLAKVTAIASSKTQLLVASKSKSQSYLQNFSWKETIEQTT